MEGFQVKENTFVERKAKESPFEIRQKIREPDSRRLGQFFKFIDECPKYLFQYPYPKVNYRIGLAGM